MTAVTRKKVGELILSALLTLAGTLFILFSTGAWDSKENARDHDADVRILIEMQQRTLDVVCDGQQVTARAYRACTIPAPKFARDQR